MNYKAKNIFTIGTSNRTIAEFINLLKNFNIRQLVDVRRFPTSRRFPHFKKENLAQSCLVNSIEYFWMGEDLGGYRSGGYDDYMHSQNFQERISRLEVIAAVQPTAICCAEKFPWKCHRRFIAKYLEKRQWQVMHIIDEKNTWHPQKSLF